MKHPERHLRILKALESATEESMEEARTRSRNRRLQESMDRHPSSLGRLPLREVDGSETP